jgi:hypothetical protein
MDFLTLLVGGLFMSTPDQKDLFAYDGGVYSSTSSARPLPFSGVKCELTSMVMPDGTIGTFNVCKKPDDGKKVAAAGDGPQPMDGVVIPMNKRGFTADENGKSW